MTNLARALPEQIARVAGIKGRYAALRGAPGLNVEPAIALMDATITRALDAIEIGDIVGELAAYQALQGFDDV